MPKHRSPVYFEIKGDFKNTNTFLERTKNLFGVGELDHYGKVGVEYLKESTPKSSPETKDGWYYTIEHGKNSASIIFNNSYVKNGNNIALVIANGHASKSGKWVQGTDFITPAITKLQNEINNRLTKGGKV